MDVKGRCAVITGSAQGLGKAFAVRLLEAGAKVCLSDVNISVGEDTLRELQTKHGKDSVHFIKCDVTKTEELTALYDGCEQYFGSKVDIFCNNAGINTYWGWKKCMDVNIMAVMAGTELAMERMSLENGGRGGLVVNTASLAGIVHGWNAESNSYFASKHAVVSLTRSLGREDIFSQTGVKVQCICPAFADTAIINDKDGGDSFRKELNESIGIISVGEVANGFMQLVEHCDNGAALVIYKDTPPMVYYDCSMGIIVVMVAMAKGLNKVFGISRLTIHHQLACIFLFLIFLHFMFNFLVSLVF